MKLLIKRGQILRSSSEDLAIFDILVSEDGLIETISETPLQRSDAEVIDASGCYVTPAFTDLSCRAGEPGFEYRETLSTLSQSLSAGGYFRALLLPFTDPPITNREIYDDIKRRVEEFSLVEVFPCPLIGIGIEFSPLSELCHRGARAFVSESDLEINSTQLRRALEWIGMHEKTFISLIQPGKRYPNASLNEGVVSHRLGLEGIPTSEEEIQVATSIALSRETGTRIHISGISSEQSVELIERAKNDELPITADTSALHLICTEEVNATFDPSTKVFPPFRRESDLEALRKGVKSSVLDAVASHHWPVEFEAKVAEFGRASFGVSSAESTVSDMFRLLKDGVISEARLVDCLSTAPSRILGVSDNLLKEGYRAEISIFNPETEWVFEKRNLKSLCGFSPHTGRRMKGRVVSRISGNRVHDYSGRWLNE